MQIIEKQRLIKYLAISVGFMICVSRISTAAVNVAGGVSLLLGLVLWYNYKNNISLSEEIKGYIKAYGVFLLLLVPSIVFSDNPAMSINGFLHEWIWRYLVFVLIVVFITRRDYLVNMLIASLTVISVECLFTFIQVMSHMNPDGRGTGFDRHVLTLGGILCMLLPLAMVILMDSRFEKKLKNAASITVISVLIALLFNKSRGAWLTELIVVPIATFRYLKQNIKYLAVALIVFFGIAGFMISSPHYVKRVQSITNTTTDMSNVGRFWVWKSASEMIRDHPVTGVGVQRFREKYLREYLYKQEIQKLGHAHNNFLHTTAESGVIGLAGLIYFIGFYLHTSLCNYRKDKNPYDILVFTIIFGYICLFGLIDYTLGIATGMRIMWFLLAVLLKMKETEGKPVSVSLGIDNNKDFVK